jgi:hypothetical protein
MRARKIFRSRLGDSNMMNCKILEIQRFIKIHRLVSLLLLRAGGRVLHETSALNASAEDMTNGDFNFGIARGQY